MDIEKCKALLCTIETGSLSAAAEKLGYTPSGMSRMMAALEEQVGFPLLDRGRNGVTPTSDCRTLLPAVYDMVRQGDRVEQLAAQVCGLEIGHVVAGTAYNYYYKWLSTLISDFGKIHPGIRITIIEGTSSHLSQMAEERRADFCIISKRRGSFRWLPLRDDPLVAWVPKDHLAAQRGSLPLELLKTEPFIEIYPGQETDNSRFLASQGIRPKTRYATSDTFAAYSMVEAGLGITLVNSVFENVWKGAVAAVPLDPPQTVSIGIALPPKEQMPPAVESFVNFASARLTRTADET